MSDLTGSERRKLEKLLGMGGGYKEPAIMNCNLAGGALQTDQCVVLAKSMFLDTGELPPEPPPKRPAKF